MPQAAWWEVGVEFVYVLSAMLLSHQVGSISRYLPWICQHPWLFVVFAACGCVLQEVLLFPAMKPEETGPAAAASRAAADAADAVQKVSI
jgi:hypothetical protein